MYGYGVPNNANMNVNSQTFKINPQVMTLIEPIIRSMTQYQQFTKVSPAYGMWNPLNSMSEDHKRQIEMAKKNCVDLVRNAQSGELEHCLEEVDDTKFRCRLCGREIYKKFDKSAVEKLQDAIAVLNMLVFFGLSLNLGAEQMSKIIFLKSSIPDAIQLVDVLNKFVKEEDSAIQTTGNIGDASQGAEFQGNLLGMRF